MRGNSRMVTFSGLLGLTIAMSALRADEPSAGNVPADVPAAVTDREAESLVRAGAGPEGLARALLLQHLPREYQNARKWGLTKPRWDGVSLSLDGLNVRTKRKWKNVNHGTWTCYEARLIDPERQLVIDFRDVRPAGNHRIAFELVVEALWDAKGRLAEWNYGVQLYSFSAQAHARVRMQMTCELGWKLDASRFPPDLVLDPLVTHARLDLKAFHLQHLSDLDGYLARRLGHNLQDDIEREINERQHKIVEKLNRAIARNHDRLRLSPHEWIASGWSKLTVTELPPATSRVSPAAGGQSPRTARREE